MALLQRAGGLRTERSEIAKGRSLCPQGSAGGRWQNGIKELREGFALPTLCLRSFWATEAALSLATLTYNLSVLFERHLGWQKKVTIHTLRFWLFVTAGVLSHPQGRATIKLAVPPRERGWWRRLWDKILSPLPNCNAVENQPVFTG